METTFKYILDVAIAHYPLEDMGLVSNANINMMVEELVTRAGYSMEDYSEWVSR